MNVPLLRLYAHAISLGLWALAFWAFAIEPGHILRGVILATLGLTAVIAERERARRRRESRRT